MLVADDRVVIEQGHASAPAGLAGLLEVRGLGILRLPHLDRAPVVLAVRLGDAVPRLPEPARHEELDVPMLALDSRTAACPQVISLALDCALGRQAQLAGAFAP